jgi:FkbM family methyltransferase
MKGLAKALVPGPLLQIARKFFWKVRAEHAPLPLSSQTHHALSALRCQVSHNQYGGYCVPLSSRHRPAARKILSNDVHEPKTIEFLMANSGNGDVIHAGTYFGDFLPALSHGCGPQYRVWAFEPNSENYKCAKITILLNDLENVILANAGLGEKESVVPLRTTDHRGNALGGGSSLVQRPDTPDSGERCMARVVAVDDVIPRDRQIAIMQLDVEGYEKEALAGSLETIRSWRPILVLEVWPGSKLLDSEWFADHILGLGYRMTEKLHGNYVFTVQKSGGGQPR